MIRYMGKEYDEFTGITTEYFTEVLEDGRVRLHMRGTQEIQDVLDANREQYNNHGKIARFGDNGIYHTARIPLMEIERWKRQYGFDWFQADYKEQRKWLMRSDIHGFRTNPGRLC